MQTISIDINKVQKGDEAECRLLFNLFYPRLMSVACRFVPEHIAEDIVQSAVSYTHLDVYKRQCFSMCHHFAGTETSTVFRFVRTFGLAVALRMIFFYDVRP